MIGAVGVDAERYKHVLAIREGATENTTVAKKLLEDLRSAEFGGILNDRRRSFMIELHMRMIDDLRLGNYSDQRSGPTPKPSVSALGDFNA